MINSFELFGDQCITMEDGKKLYDLILKELETNEHAVVSFDGIVVFMSPFFNASFGALLQKYSRADLEAKVKIADLSEDGRFVYDRALTNAQAFYTNEKVRDAHNHVFNKPAED